MTDETVHCIWCRRPEANTYLLESNHWGRSYRVQTTGICIAQELTRNHVAYSVDQLGDGKVDRFGRPRDEVTLAQRDRYVEMLERDIERATLLWSHRDDIEWLDEARDVLVMAQAAQIMRGLEVGADA